MGEEIRAIRFDIQEIGKHVKGSKKRFTWTFSLNGKNHTIILDFSFISGKVKLSVDRKTMLQSQLPTNVSFQHPFTLDGYALNILQQGQTFQLRINNKVFSHLYNQAKTNTQFKNYEDQVKDIKVDEAHFQNASKKITLNIGAMGGMKKKPKVSVESQNWANFGGQDGFPNYFGQGTTTNSAKQEVKVANKSNLLDDDEQTQETKKQQNLFDLQPISQSQKPQIKKTQEIDFFAEQTSPTTTKQVHVQFTKTQVPTPPADDFNTMQNMFATMQVDTTQNKPAQQTSSLDFFNQVSSEPQIQAQKTQSPSLFVQQPSPNIDINDFNTMQNLFATSNPGQVPQAVTVQQTTTAIQSNTKVPSQNAQMFSTMSFGQNNNNQQNMFNTNYQQASSNPLDLLALKQEMMAQQQNANRGSAPAATMNAQQLNMQDFNTMQNLFKTQGMPMNMPQNSGMQQSAPANFSAQQFNTMQNLFNTSNYQGSNTSTAQFDMSSFGIDDSSITKTQSQSTAQFGKKSQPLEQDLL